MSYTQKVFPWYMQTSLNELRLAGASCDVVIVVDGFEWRAHKTVLASASPYFWAMFQLDFKEARNRRVTLSDVHPEAMSAILDFIYSAKLTITHSNVIKVLEAANYMQVYPATLWITNYVHRGVSPDICIELYEKSKALHFFDLAEVAEYNTRRNFSQVIQLDNFKRTSWVFLNKLLDSKFLNVANEGVLIPGIMKWINGDLEARRGYTIELFNKIELRDTPIQSLIDLKNELIFKGSTPNELEDYLDSKIMEWYAINEKPVENNMKWKIMRYGAEQGVILVMGGEINDVSSKTMECFTFGYDTWKTVVPEYVHGTKGPKSLVPLPSMIHARTYPAVAFDSHNVYLLGGRNYIHYLSECETFNITTRTWTSLPRLPLRLEGGSAVIFEGRLIFIGGRTRRGYVTNRAWELDLAGQTWKDFPRLNYPRAFHASIAHGGYIYALGGMELDNETSMKKVERYDPSENKWFEIPSMEDARAKFGCVLLNNCIYVMGGIDGFVSLRTVERYDLEANTWSYMAPMLASRHSLSVVVFNKKIYCLGGSDDLRTLQSVEKYNPSTDYWHCLFTMQAAKRGMAAVVLYVPFVTRDI